MVENHSKIERSQLLHLAGFSAIFIEASYSIGRRKKTGSGLNTILLKHLKGFFLKLFGSSFQGLNRRGETNQVKHLTRKKIALRPDPKPLDRCDCKWTC